MYFFIFEGGRGVGRQLIWRHVGKRFKKNLNKITFRPYPVEDYKSTIKLIFSEESETVLCSYDSCMILATTEITDDDAS